MERGRVWHLYHHVTPFHQPKNVVCSLFLAGDDCISLGVKQKMTGGEGGSSGLAGAKGGAGALGAWM